MTKKQLLVKLSIVSNKISEAIISKAPAEDLEGLIQESLEIMDALKLAKRQELVEDFVAKKLERDWDVTDMRAIAYARRLVEDGQQDFAEIYCHFLTKGEVKVPSEFHDFVDTLSAEDLETFARSSRVDIKQYLKENE